MLIALILPIGSFRFRLGGRVCQKYGDTKPGGADIYLTAIGLASSVGERSEKAKPVREAKRGQNPKD